MKDLHQIISLADRGNIDAGKDLLARAADYLRAGQMPPPALRLWLADRLDAVRAAPKQAGSEMRVTHGRGQKARGLERGIEEEQRKSQIAWAVFHAIAAKEAPTQSRDGSRKTVFDVIAQWAGVSPRQAQRYFDERKDQMAKHQAEIDRLIADTGSPRK